VGKGGRRFEGTGSLGRNDLLGWEKKEEEGGIGLQAGDWAGFIVMDEKGSAGNGQGPKGPFAKLSDRQGPVLVGASTATSAHPWLPPRFGCFGMKRFAGRGQSAAR
jgi:hypothetical protein